MKFNQQEGVDTDSDPHDIVILKTWVWQAVSPAIGMGDGSIYVWHEQPDRGKNRIYGANLQWF